jgi:hypothetical protein
VVMVRLLHRSSNLQPISISGGRMNANDRRPHGQVDGA